LPSDEDPQPATKSPLIMMTAVRCGMSPDRTSPPITRV
jgi:hypothetical protein